MPRWGGWPEIDNKTISVQLNLTGTATGTELGNIILLEISHAGFVAARKVNICKGCILCIYFINLNILQMSNI